LFLGEEISARAEAQLGIITTVYQHRLTERVTTPPAERHTSVEVGSAT
jgi:hypothetical protein